MAGIEEPCNRSDVDLATASQGSPLVLNEQEPPQATDELTVAVRENTAQLQQLIQQLRSPADSSFTYHEAGQSADEALQTIDEHIRLQCENDSLLSRIDQLQEENAILRAQNSELASDRAKQDIEQTVSDSGGTSPAMSWEERKLQVLRQLEEDSSDAESLLSTLNTDSRLSGSNTGKIEDPIAYIESLNNELARMANWIRRYEEENQEIQELFRRDDDAESAIAAAALVDNDEVVREEREKLRQLQSEWEKRFQEAEMEASLERAKLSRQRVELQLKNEQLKEQLEALQRQTEEQQDDGGKERLMAKLGIRNNRKGKHTLNDQD